MNRLAIIGGGDLGVVIANLVSELSEFELVGFFDDFAALDDKIEVQCARFPILGRSGDVSDSFVKGHFDQLIIGIGYNHFQVRQAFYDRWNGLIPFANVFHPSVIIDKSCRMGEGIVLLAGCILDKNVMIGNNVLLNIGVAVSHDGIIGDHSFLGPRCALAGYVHIGKRCFLGVGSVIIDNVKITDDVQIGGGALVIDEIPNAGLYVGVPVRRIK